MVIKVSVNLKIIILIVIINKIGIYITKRLIIRTTEAVIKIIKSLVIVT